jgi:hypothetical protein
MADTGEELTNDAAKFSVEVSPHSHLVFSKLKQYKEVVFWERPEIPELFPSDLDTYLPLQIQDRIDNLSYTAYRDSVLFWVLTVANDVRLPPLYMQPGYRFRIPDQASVISLLRGQS